MKNGRLNKCAAIKHDPLWVSDSERRFIRTLVAGGRLIDGRKLEMALSLERRGFTVVTRFKDWTATVCLTALGRDRR